MQDAQGVIDEQHFCHRRRSDNDQTIVEYRARYGRSLAKTKLSEG